MMKSMTLVEAMMFAAVDVSGICGISTEILVDKITQPSEVLR